MSGDLIQRRIPPIIRRVVKGLKNVRFLGNPAATLRRMHGMEKALNQESLFRSPIKDESQLPIDDVGGTRRNRAVTIHPAPHLTHAHTTQHNTTPQFPAPSTASLTAPFIPFHLAARAKVPTPCQCRRAGAAAAAWSAGRALGWAAARGRDRGSCPPRARSAPGCGRSLQCNGMEGMDGSRVGLCKGLEKGGNEDNDDNIPSPLPPSTPLHQHQKITQRTRQEGLLPRVHLIEPQWLVLPDLQPQSPR